MTDMEILNKAMDIIGEYGHIENGEVVQTYSDLIKSIEKFMEKVGYEND